MTTRHLLSAILAITLTSVPAKAETFHKWGDDLAFTVELVEGTGGAHVASVIAHNEMTQGFEVVTTTLDGGVIVTIDMKDGDIPDIVIVTAPQGYIAIPAQLSLEEGATGEIRILRLDSMILG